MAATRIAPPSYLSPCPRGMTTTKFVRSLNRLALSMEEPPSEVAERVWYPFSSEAMAKKLDQSGIMVGEILPLEQNRQHKKVIAVNASTCTELAEVTELSGKTENPKRVLEQAGLTSEDSEKGLEALKDLQDGLDALGQSNRLQIAYGLQKCTSLAHVKRFHYHIMSVELGQDTYLANLLLSMYAKYGALKDSRAVFDKMLDRSVVTWTAIITAHARRGHGKDALFLYKRMQQEGTPPNNVTFISLCGACASQETLIDGKRIHACLDKDQLSDVVVGTALVTMYGRCGSVKNARAIFDRLPNGNIVSWNAMITVYADHEQGKEALRLFHQMQLEGLKPNDCTYINSLKACSILTDIAQGRAIHSCVVEHGLLSDVVVGNALLNMYGKCGAPDEARCIFLKMQEHDLVTWNGIITAYAQQGLGAEGLELFRNMQQQGVKPDMVTFISVVSACASLAALEEGKCIHACLLNDGLESDVQVGNALIHMYGRCGALGSARSVFDKVRPHNVISWTAIIAAFSQQGHAKAALQLFREMQQERVKPDEITYITLLSACSHAGLVEEGRSCFVSMEKDYGLTARVEHYVCMIDLLGRAGMLAEAEEFIRKMPFWPDGRLWSALLASCKIHSDTFRGKHAADQMINLGPKDTTPYVLLGNLYAANGRRDDLERIRTVMDKMVELCKGCKK